MLIIYNLMNDLDCKSKFLQKKKQEKKKVELKTEEKNYSMLLQKNIRSFLARSRLHLEAQKSDNLEFSLIMGSDLRGFSQQIIYNFLDKIEQFPYAQKLNYLKKLVIACMKNQDEWMISILLKIVKNNPQLIRQVANIDAFPVYLESLLKLDLGSKILDLSIKELIKNQKIKRISSKLLTSVCLRPYQENYLDVQGVRSLQIDIEAVILIFSTFNISKDQINLQQISLGALCRILSKALTVKSQLKNNQNNYQTGLSNLFFFIRKLIASIYSQTVQTMVKNNKNLLNLIEDDEQLEYFETKMKEQDQYSNFCDRTLIYLEKIFEHPEAMHYLMTVNVQCRQNISDLISDINVIYDAKKILWVYSFLSNDNVLHSLKKYKTPEFYRSLKMKILTMDALEFANSQIFSNQQWKEIIKHSIRRGFELGKAIAGQNFLKNKTKKLLIPFQKKDDDETNFLNLSELMNNLYKKCLYTKKIPVQIFIDPELDKLMNTFVFGIGARALEMMLKNFPFAFRFETRMKKLKQFIKEDKKNYDRTLFMQDQIDQDLIVNIRRGHQFLDAYQHCLHKDLRKKYKIVFFNEQNLEEEGIDGGGIIKQFINRVLKSSFSEVFGMFYETSRHQILPNNYSPSTQQYEFIGKVVGKAVYQGINIQYKFAEPFLNLLIGRQNSFEDLQYIDAQIYDSLLKIKRYDGDITELQQTFTILDQLPNGIKKVINLKNPNSTKITQQLPITNENKLEFVMSYSDFKCNKQLEEKTRLFRRGFLKVMKSEWLTMFSNQQLNQIISGGQPNYLVDDLRYNVVLNGYQDKSQTILDLWQTLKQFTPEEKSLFLLFVTSCPRPPTLGFATMKPLICISKSQEITFLPTANTCMNVIRLPDYKNRQDLKKKLLYAINAKAGFQIA